MPTGMPGDNFGSHFLIPPCKSEERTISNSLSGFASSTSAPSPIASRTFKRNLLNSSVSKRRVISFASAGAIFRSEIPTPRSRSSTSRLSCLFRLTSATCSRNACPRFPPILSAFSKTPSRPSYLLIHPAAVFGPTPGTPGRWSALSPTNAARCG